MGLIGGGLFACACIPMAWHVYRKGNTTGIAPSSTWLFLVALSMYFGYLFAEFGWHLPFVFGLVEIACWLVVLKYQLYPVTRATRPTGW